MPDNSPYSVHIDNRTIIQLDGILKPELEKAQRQIERLTSELEKTRDELVKAQDKIKALEKELAKPHKTRRDHLTGSD